jgi:hypothetical protein
VFADHVSISLADQTMAPQRVTGRAPEAAGIQ